MSLKSFSKREWNIVFTFTCCDYSDSKQNQVQ